MADLLNIIGTSLRQLAAWLGIGADTLVIFLFLVVAALFLIMFLALLIAIRMKPPPARVQPDVERGKPVGLEYIEKTLLEFPAGKVQIEANVEKLVLKLVETEPKVVERIVEVPAKEKPAEVPPKEKTAEAPPKEKPPSEAGTPSS